MQSAPGIELCKKYNIDTNIIDSIILIKPAPVRRTDGRSGNDKVCIKSAAVLEILKDLPIGWRVFRSGIILPKVIRDWLYDFIAKHRYRIFGKKDECPIPSEDVQDRFL